MAICPKCNENPCPEGVPYGEPWALCLTCHFRWMRPLVEKHRAHGPDLDREHGCTIYVPQRGYLHLLVCDCGHTRINNG